MSKTLDNFREYFRASSEPLQALALTLPLIIVYGIGILVAPEAQNGVDLLTGQLYDALQLAGKWRGLGYFALYGLLIGLDIGLWLWLVQSRRFSMQFLIPLLGECALYAMLTGTVASWVTRDLTQALHAIAPVHGLWPLAAGLRKFQVIDGVIVSAGAGLHEELVFRLLSIGLVARLWLGRDWRKCKRQLVILLVATSIAFALAHYMVEPFTISSFIFRTVSGLIFGTLFLLRGFAVAAWTHALYDLWVILLLGLS